MKLCTLSCYEGSFVVFIRLTLEKSFVKFLIRCRVKWNEVIHRRHNCRQGYSRCKLRWRLKMDLVLTDKDYRAMTCRQNLLTNGEDGVETHVDSRWTWPFLFTGSAIYIFFFYWELFIFTTEKVWERGRVSLYKGRIIFEAQIFVWLHV